MIYQNLILDLVTFNNIPRLVFVLNIILIVFAIVLVTCSAIFEGTDLVVIFFTHFTLFSELVADKIAAV